LTAGTLFAGTKLPLTKWLPAIYLLTQSKSGISASFDLSRQLGAAAALSPPMPYRLVMLAEAHG